MSDSPTGNRTPVSRACYRCDDDKRKSWPLDHRRYCSYEQMVTDWWIWLHCNNIYCNINIWDKIKALTLFRGSSGVRTVGLRWCITTLKWISRIIYRHVEHSLLSLVRIFKSVANVKLQFGGRNTCELWWATWYVRAQPSKLCQWQPISVVSTTRRSYLALFLNLIGSPVAVILLRGACFNRAWLSIRPLHRSFFVLPLTIMGVYKPGSSWEVIRAVWRT